ncbi:hypothetical protein D3879_02280 [Pseudomonas cavernicola]|uniref:Lipoprotein n=1 Tax=Pseudomonas cavernicola TaxID=2320866 RepID=A0A418XI74_9PSED|nr:hypothetical protein [Pseudomonas cavernicola]RJG12172.1 hypothetical protein D3879_02280 [Pseudomonas cavernicola]
MLLRPLALLTALSLLAACAGEPAAPLQAPAFPKAAAAPTPVPAHLRELTGSLLNVPAGGDVELALLIIDERNRPQRLLGNITLSGNGATLRFSLRFNPESFPPGARVELRGRVSRSAQLILRLRPLRIQSATSQALGELRFVAAP